MIFNLNNHILRRQGVVILDSVDLQIRAGEKVAVLGASGAGKSSLLEALRAQHPQLCAWCPQQGALVPVLSVFHNIYMGSLDRHGTLYNLRNLIAPSPQEKHRVGALARDLGLEDKLFVSVDRLSGGQAQRTALGRALYSQRAILLGDEPVSSVDEVQGRHLLRHALQCHETAVVALHDQSLARDCFDRVVGLRGGRIVLDTAAARLDARALADLYAT